MRLIVAAVLAVLAVPADAGGLCRGSSGGLPPLRRRLRAARLRGDGLSLAALVSLSGIVSRGLDQPAAASRPPGLEEAGLCGENGGLDREAHVRLRGFAPELTCRRPTTPIQNISGLAQGLVRRRGDRVIVPRSLHLFAPKEVHHERAGRTAVAHSRHRGSRALFGRLPPRHVSVGVRPGLVLTPSATADVKLEGRSGATPDVSRQDGSRFARHFNCRRPRQDQPCRRRDLCRRHRGTLLWSLAGRA
jgi:hypothetical protein